MKIRALSVILTIALAAGTLGGAFSGAPAALASPTTEMYLSPNSGTYSTAGADFSVTVMLNTGGETVNTVRAYLTFDSTRLSVASITGGLAFPMYFSETYDNDTGTIDVSRGTGGGITFNGIGSIATIAFHPKADGAAAVQIVLAQSVVCKVAIPPPNVLSIAGSASYTIVSPGVTLSTSTVTVTEGGAGSSYTVVLVAPPSASVSVAVTPDTQVTASPGTLTFTTGNWSTPQTVTVNAVDDAAAEGAHTGTISHAVTSTDSAYNGLSVGSVTANITDNDYTLTYTAGTGGSITAPATSPTTRTSGAIVTITAAPNAGYHFVNWTGDVATVANVTAASTTITMNANYAIQANFAGHDTTITVASGGNGTVTPVSSFTQTYGATGTAITASPATGYHFVSWSATSNPTYVTIASPTSASTSVTTTPAAPDGSTATVTATFAVTSYTLTYSAGTNGHIDGTSPQTVTHGGSGTQVTATPDSGYHFVQWSDDVMTASRTDTGVTASISVTATFAPNDVTITVASGGNGTVTPVSPFTQTYGATGTAITASPAIGYHFVSWSATSNPSYVTIASPTSASTSITTTPAAPDGSTVTVTATFAVTSYTLTYSAGTNGHIDGTSPQTVTHGGSGTQVTATPDTGYHFVKWSDDVMTASRTDTGVTASISVTATFAGNAYTLAASIVGSGDVVKVPDQATYTHGTVVRLTATPLAGWSFTSWSGDVPAGHEMDNPLALTMDGNKTVTATFTEGAISSLITHYYSSLLDRSPDEPGRLFWLSEIARIQSLGIDVREGFIALARLFLTSPEYLAKGTSDAAYITALYKAFFNRDPDTAGLIHWTGLMADGMSRDITMNWFVYSPEYAAYMTGILGSAPTRPENNLVNDLYRGFLNRLPDSGGFATQLAVMRAAQASGAAAVRTATRTIALAFLGSTEYALRARTNIQFIEDCYNGILRRGALAAEIQYWVDFLAAGHTRIETLNYFVDSLEFQTRVDELIAAGPYTP